MSNPAVTVSSKTEKSAIPDPSIPPVATPQLVDSDPEPFAILSTRSAVPRRVKSPEVGRSVERVSIVGVTRRRLAMERTRLVRKMSLNQMVRLSLALKARRD